jgi:hypothetical protein
MTLVSQVSPTFRDVTVPLIASVEPCFAFGVAITASSAPCAATNVSADNWSCPLNGVENAAASALPLLVDASGVKLVIVTNDGSCFATLDSSSVRSGPASAPAGAVLFENTNHDAAPETSTMAAAAAISHGVFVDDAGTGVGMAAGVGTACNADPAGDVGIGTFGAAVRLL